MKAVLRAIFAMNTIPTGVYESPAVIDAWISQTSITRSVQGIVRALSHAPPLPSDLGPLARARILEVLGPTYGLGVLVATQNDRAILDEASGPAAPATLRACAVLNPALPVEFMRRKTIRDEVKFFMPLAVLLAPDSVDALRQPEFAQVLATRIRERVLPADLDRARSLALAHPEVIPTWIDAGVAIRYPAELSLAESARRAGKRAILFQILSDFEGPDSDLEAYLEGMSMKELIALIPRSLELPSTFEELNDLHEARLLRILTSACFALGMRSLKNDPECEGIRGALGFQTQDIETLLLLFAEDTEAVTQLLYEADDRRSTARVITSRFLSRFSARPDFLEVSLGLAAKAAQEESATTWRSSRLPDLFRSAVEQLIDPERLLSGDLATIRERAMGATDAISAIFDTAPRTLLTAAAGVFTPTRAIEVFDSCLGEGSGQPFLIECLSPPTKKALAGLSHEWRRLLAIELDLGDFLETLNMRSAEDRAWITASSAWSEYFAVQAKSRISDIIFWASVREENGADGHLTETGRQMLESAPISLLQMDRAQPYLAWLSDERLTELIESSYRSVGQKAARLTIQACVVLAESRGLSALETVALLTSSGLDLSEVPLPDQLSNGIAVALSERLGADESSWDLLLRLLPDWGASLDGLLAVVSGSEPATLT